MKTMHSNLLMLAFLLFAPVFQPPCWADPSQSELDAQKTAAKQLGLPAPESSLPPGNMTLVDGFGYRSGFGTPDVSEFEKDCDSRDEGPFLTFSNCKRFPKCQSVTVLRNSDTFNAGRKIVLCMNRRGLRDDEKSSDEMFAVVRLWPRGVTEKIFYFESAAREYRPIASRPELIEALGPLDTAEKAEEFLVLFTRFRVKPEVTKITSTGSGFAIVKAFSGSNRCGLYSQTVNLTRDGGYEVDQSSVVVEHRAEVSDC